MRNPVQFYLTDISLTYSLVLTLTQHFLLPFGHTGRIELTKQLQETMILQLFQDVFTKQDTVILTKQMEISKRSSPNSLKLKALGLQPLITCYG